MHYHFIKFSDDNCMGETTKRLPVWSNIYIIVAAGISSSVYRSSGAGRSRFRSQLLQVTSLTHPDQPRLKITTKTSGQCVYRLSSERGTSSIKSNIIPLYQNCQFLDMTPCILVGHTCRFVPTLRRSLIPTSLE
jgi:hypothetical protein